MTQPDEFLTRVRRFEPEALAAVFDLYYEPLYRYLYFHIHQQEDAEDLAAQVFQRLLTALREARGPQSHLRAWLYQVARHLLVDYTRRQQHRQHAPLETEIAAAGLSLEQITQRALLNEQTAQALTRLNERQRDVLILRFLQGWPLDEVAEFLGISVGAVKALQHRALVAMRAQLGDLEHTEP